MDTASVMSRWSFVVPCPSFPSFEAWAMYIFGPMSGVTRSEGNRAARFMNPLRRVYRGKGKAFSKSANKAGKISAKSSEGGQSYNEMGKMEIP